MWMQVIALTEELLATAKQNDISGSDIGTSGRASPSLPHSKMVIPHPSFFLCVCVCLVTWPKNCVWLSWVANLLCILLKAEVMFDSYKKKKVVRRVLKGLPWIWPYPFKQAQEPTCQSKQPKS